eukprot:6205915-Pleurochrysis_carterae.AAC.1
MLVSAQVSLARASPRAARPLSLIRWASLVKARIAWPPRPSSLGRARRLWGAPAVFGARLRAHVRRTSSVRSCGARAVRAAVVLRCDPPPQTHAHARFLAHTASACVS